MVILENIDIDIDKAILQNIDIDKISNRFKFGISNRATPNSDFYPEIQELAQILLRISEEKFGGWGLCWQGKERLRESSHARVTSVMF